MQLQKYVKKTQNARNTQLRVIRAITENYFILEMYKKIFKAKYSSYRSRAKNTKVHERFESSLPKDTFERLIS